MVNAFSLPWFFSWYEVWSGNPLSYEGALRLTLITTIELLIAFSFVWLLMRGRRSHWLLWWIQCVSYATLLVIFFGDTTHRLMEEFSWIRYTTAGFLVLAGLLGVILFYSYWKEGVDRNMKVSGNVVRNVLMQF